MQGLGAAGPYVLSVAIVRDRFEGREMSKILSFIMMIFIGIPIIAPFIGQGILLLAGWRSIFVALAIFAALSCAWFVLRQGETLDPQNRVPVNPSTMISAVKEVLGNQQSRRYLIASSAITGAFIAYLSTGQQVFQEMYALGTRFPIVFASLAIMFGLSSYLNARWVQSLGSSLLVHRALSTLVVTSSLFALMVMIKGGLPPLWLHLGYMSVIMFCYGMLFGNITSLAMEPMGHIAGSASSIINCLSTLVAIMLSVLIGAQLQDSTLPIIAGFALTGAVAGGLNYAHLKQRGSAAPTSE